MRRAGVLVWLWAAAGWPAAAQTPVVVPPAPPIVATPPGGAPAPAPTFSAPPASLAEPQVVTPSGAPTNVTPQTPTLVPAAPGGADQAAPANADTGTTTAAPAPADSWQPGGVAELGVLDEVDGSVTQVQVGVGGQARIGDLEVSVLACLRRPPGQIPDAAAFLAVQPAPAGADGQAADGAAPSYRGWMLRSAPGAAVVGDGSETFRVIDCG